MMVQSLRCLSMIGALAFYRLSFLVEPIYIARPQTLIEPSSILVPPRLFSVVSEIVVLVLLLCTVESLVYRKAFGWGWKEASRSCLRTYSPLTVLWCFSLLFVPGLPFVPMLGWWMLLDARHWVLTLALAGVIYQKSSILFEHWPELPKRMARFSKTRSATLLYGLVLIVTFVALTPMRRFSQPYDERWGTGDEPRYVRIAASLLHDGDADVSNAADLIGKKAEPLVFVSRIIGWIPSTFRSVGELAGALLGSKPVGEARSLGGQVIEGRQGGTFYVYLPGFPLLLVPAVALDSILHPERLCLMLFTCLVLGTATVIVTARLVEPFIGGRASSYGLGLALGLTVPLFLHHFQAYPEVTAALCVSTLLFVLLAPRLPLGKTLAFSAAATLVPWLHPKYYPIWAVCMLGFAWKVWREQGGWKRFVLGIGLPVSSMGLLCLYIFHITGSIMPDSLWILSGYPREAAIINRTTLVGLYHLFFGSWQGLLVYGPLYVLALPGLFVLRRKSTFAFFLSLAIVVPYLVIAASHDMGGAGGWIPPSRYLVVLVPVFALWMAPWLGRPEGKVFRWTVLFLGASASFWIGLGMLEEPNFIYDRPAFLASPVVNPSPVLGTVMEQQPVVRRLAYPAFLVSVLGWVLYGTRRRWLATPAKMGAALLGGIFLGGLFAAAWSEPHEWISLRDGRGPLRVRSVRSSYLILPECDATNARLRFVGDGGPHGVTVRGVGFERHLRVPPTGTTELVVLAQSFVRFSREGRRSIQWIELELEEGHAPLTARGVCP